MRRSRTLVAVVSLVVGLVVPSDGPSRTRPQPCDGGRYFVDGDVVLVPGGAAPDVVRVGDTIEILSGCPAVNVKTRLQKSGTNLKATFKGCSGLAGNATLKGKIAAGCATMKATFRSKKDRIRTPFTATLSVCGDGRFDPEGGEECDAGQGACGAGACNAECLCTSLPTTTAAPTTTSTSSTTSTSVTPTTQALPTSTAAPTTSSTSTVAPTTSSTVAPTTSTTTLATTTTSTTSTSKPSTSSTTATPTTTTSSTAPPATVPDLRATAFTSNTLIVDAGSSLTVSWTVKNEGLLPANQPWTDYVYFNNTGNVGGTFIGEAHSQNLAVNDTYSVTNKTFNIPNVPAGTYYLVLQVDGNNNVNEGPNESDNVWPTPIQITVRTPDLRPTAFSSSTMIVDAGSSLTVSWSVVNEGTAQAKQPWTDYVYFNSTGNVGGTFIGSARSQNLAAGDSYSVNTQTFNIPNVPAGTYYLVLQVDGNNNVYEGSDEGDDVYPTTIQLTVRTPDLRPTAFSASTMIVDAGTSLTVSWSVVNEGTAQAKQPWTDYVYFNSTGNVGGTFIGAAHSSNLAAGDSYSVNTQTFNIPNVAAGTYYLVLQVDGNNNVYEGNDEGDNTYATTIQLTVRTPDLRPTAFTSSTMVVDAGTSLTVSWTVTNEGTGTAKQPWTDYVYFNSTGNVGGTFIGSAHTQDLAAGGSYSVNNQTFNIPNVAAGTYYLVLQIDGNNNVYEGSDESDNTYPTTIQLTVRTPDLRATAFSVDDQTVSVGQMVHVSWTVTNEGTAQAKQPWTDYAYFNATGNVGGTFIGAAHSSDLAAAASYSVTNQTFTIPSVTPGSYFLVLQVDGNNNVYEGNQEGDNVFSTVIPITVQ